jgi:hypothetical protein
MGLLTFKIICKFHIWGRVSALHRSSRPTRGNLGVDALLPDFKLFRRDLVLAFLLRDHVSVHLNLLQILESISTKETILQRSFHL